MAKLAKHDRETYRRLGHRQDRARFLASINRQAQALAADQDLGLERGMMVEARVQKWVDAQNKVRPEGQPEMKVSSQPYGKGKPHGIRITVSFKAPRGTPETQLVNIAWTAATLIRTSVRYLAAGVIGNANLSMKENQG